MKILKLTNIDKHTMIDNEDFEKVNQFKWYVSKQGYVIHNQHYTKNHKRIYVSIRLNRFIMNAPKGKVIDHINHDLLDNRKQNLRICGQTENLMNTGLRKDNKSGYRGIFWRKDKNKYLVYLYKNNKKVYGHYFKTLEGAILARKLVERIYFKEFAYKTNI